jgi:hypothetical protein
LEDFTDENGHFKNFRMLSVVLPLEMLILKSLGDFTGENGQFKAFRKL